MSNCKKMNDSFEKRFMSINGQLIEVIIKSREYYNACGRMSFSTKYDFHVGAEFHSVVVVEDDRKCIHCKLIGNGEDYLAEYQKIFG